MDLLREWPVMTLTVAALWVVTGGLPAAIAAGPANASPGLTNTICPVMEDEPVDPDIFVEHDGQRVYLCCERCLRRFEANPDRYGQDIARVMQVSESSVDDEADVHDEADHGEHDHTAHEPVETTNPLLRFIAWLGRFHPPTVAFPIGLLTGAGVAELLFMMSGKRRFDHAASFCVWFGIIMTVVAGTLGWFFAGFRLVDDNWLLTTHRWVGTAAVFWMLLLGWLAARVYGSEQDEGRTAYRFALLVAVILIAANGYFGGAMVYGLDHYAW
jgi:uncharacterized membrane protein